MEGWRILFPFIFLCTSHNLRLFLCRNGAGMDGICFSSLKGSGLAHDKIFAGNTLRTKDARKIFCKTSRRSDLASYKSPEILFIIPQTRKFRIRESESLREIGISVRTLQTCRDKGLLPYSCIKYKIFYKPEDVEAFLKLSYHQQNRVK